MRILCFCLFFLGSLTTHGTQTVRVGVLPFMMPFVGMDSENKPIGILGETWREIAKRQGWTSTYISLAPQDLGNIEELVKKVDVILAPLEQWFLEGLRYSDGVFVKEMGIMQVAVGDSFTRILKENWDAISLVVLALLFSLLLASSVGLYFQYFRFQKEFSKDGLVKGLIRSFLTSVMAVLGTSPYPFSSLWASWSMAPARVVMYVSLAIIGGVVSASYTVNVLGHRIMSVGDLVGKNIAVVQPTLFESRDFVSAWGSYERIVQTIGEGMALARQHEVDGVVAPMASLENYRTRHPEKDVIITGLDLKPIVLGIPFSPSFIHGKKFMQDLRTLQSQGFMYNVCAKYLTEGGVEQCLY